MSVICGNRAQLTTVGSQFVIVQRNMWSIVEALILILYKGVRETERDSRDHGDGARGHLTKGTSLPPTIFVLVALLLSDVHN